MLTGSSKSLKLQWNVVDHEEGLVSDFDTFLKYLDKNVPLDQVRDLHGASLRFSADNT